MSDDISAMLSNHNADSWSEVRGDDDAVYDDPSTPPLERLDAYVDHCFDVYDVVSANLSRDQIQTCIADWDRRRGEAHYNRQMKKRRFGKRVSRTHKRRRVGQYCVFLAKALVGVPPEDDRGVGWKATTRHELGHVIDHVQRGESDHGPKFKAVMRQFGEDGNDGKSQHGYPPRWHR